MMLFGIYISMDDFLVIYVVYDSYCMQIWYIYILRINLAAMVAKENNDCQGKTIYLAAMVSW
jgi:hypothetical protein